MLNSIPEEWVISLPFDIRTISWIDRQTDIRGLSISKGRVTLRTEYL